MPAPGNGTQRRPSHAKEICECGDDRDDGKAESHSGQSFNRSMWNVSDIDPVHDAVHDIDELCQCHGNRKVQNIPGDASPAEVIAAPAVIPVLLRLSSSRHSAPPFLFLIPAVFPSPARRDKKDAPGTCTAQTACRAYTPSKAAMQSWFRWASSVFQNQLISC